MPPKKQNYLAKFFEGVTFFHVAGLFLMIGGGFFGPAEKVGGENFLNSGFGLVVYLTAAQIFGGLIFFYELLKVWFRRGLKGDA